MTTYMHPDEIKAKVDEFGPRAWVEALRSNQFLHMKGALGHWPQAGLESQPVMACCIGVLAVASGVASNQPTEAREGTPGVEIAWSTEDDDDTPTASDDTELIDDTRPWWLGGTLLPSGDDLDAFHPALARHQDSFPTGIIDVQQALILINDWDGSGDGEADGDTSTTDYSKQIEFIEKFIIPAYEANGSAS